MAGLLLAAAFLTKQTGLAEGIAVLAASRSGRGAGSPSRPR